MLDFACGIIPTMFRAAWLIVILGLACAPVGENEQNKPHGVTVVPPCQVGGCSAHVCTDRSDVATTCEWRAEYACYQTARCEPQPGGQCGWTQTPELVACIEAARRQ